VADSKLQQLPKIIKIVNLLGIIVDADYWASILLAPALVGSERRAAEIDHQITAIRRTLARGCVFWMEQ
jgi:hypothetical protein